ncbi:trypsin-like peptidase domain-containing protein [Ponticaulis sp.]|uniref:trypsin-like peptidase domain-containing protein n=1 Tax=Ponticaulis sp. TaxID=2020902 RepID=UPI000B6FFF1D|nr:trypsin-like peptidase domain-containing protein [Ponticaulis sp.]MAI91539.1 trypsin [Ponticaulis sp.]OUX97570.1 MAG: trypsin [Hyphomonadaceae bacterium TMED5]|tara:strand:+ start:54310 stop:55035 length:726 start_codon:yes stop_codon:yes gene_type:complete
MIEPVLMTTVRISTFDGQIGLTNATGFFFEQGGVLQLISSRHVVFEEPSGHRPDRIEIELHVSLDDLGQSINFSIPLYRNGKNVWREIKDSAGWVDFVAIDIDKDALPETFFYTAFSPAHLVSSSQRIEIGSTLLVIGYPLGFEDTLHHLPVARQAGLASSYGLRFRGQGYFLVDARTHRGISGAPVVMQNPKAGLDDPLPWRLLGVHSSRLEAFSRDPVQDEILGLNAVWYADALTALIE